MADNYLPIILSASIGAIVATIANYIYYIKTTHKEHKIEFIEKQITELLLPLYFHIQLIDGKNYDELNDTFREDEHAFVEVLIKDNKIGEITTAKLYLASPDLSSLLLRFLDIQYVSEFGDGYDEDYILTQYDNLRKAIYKEYKDKVRVYQENY